jgi:hypothetical protein
VLLSLPLAVLLAAVGGPVLARWAWSVARSLDGPPQDAAHLAAGVALGLGLVWWKRPNWLVHTTIHETCHALVCLLLLVPVRSFQVSDGRGGAILHDRTDWLRTMLIAIAPYTLPLLLVPALLVQEHGPAGWRAGATFAVGLLAVHHLHGLWHNVRLNFLGRQGDLARVGRILSLVLIAGGLLAVAVAVMRALWDAPPAGR